jgi:hypothetical protein
MTNNTVSGFFHKQQVIVGAHQIGKSTYYSQAYGGSGRKTEVCNCTEECDICDGCKIIPVPLHLMFTREEIDDYPVTEKPVVIHTLMKPRDGTIRDYMISRVWKAASINWKAHMKAAGIK